MVQSGLKIVTGLAHIGVFVSDIERSLVFYQDILSFECCRRAEMKRQQETIRYAFIKNGDCVIELIEKPDAKKKEDGPVNHIALEVADVAAAMAQLKSKGVVFEKDEPASLPMLGLKFVMFRGPDGERLELLQQL